MAAKFWVGGGTNTNWSSSPVTNWANSSGGAGNQTAPGSGDDVTFDGAGSGNGASIVAVNTTILSLTFTSGYTNTLTIGDGAARALTVNGHFTDNTAHSWAINSSATSPFIISGTSTITPNSKTFPGGVQLSGTKTIVGNWTISGVLTPSVSVTINKTTAEVISCAGLNISGTIAGTINITITGGTWSGNNTANTMTGTIAIAGNVTVSGICRINGCTLSYTSGTVTTTGSTIQLDGSCTFSTSGIQWNIMTVIGVTVTINSLLSVTTMNCSTTGTAPTFAGTAGFTVGTLSCAQTSALTITLVNNVTYTITTAFNAFSSRVGSILLFTSDHATNRTNLILQNDSTICNVLASFTRIDASGGRPIITFNGTITDSPNVIQQSNVLYVPPKSFNRGSRRLQLSNKNKAVIYT